MRIHLQADHEKAESAIIDLQFTLGELREIVAGGTFAHEGSKALAVAERFYAD